MGRICDKCNQKLDGPLKPADKKTDISLLITWVEGEKDEEKELEFDLCEPCMRNMLLTAFDTKIP
jgi:hypothetical protein